MWLMRCSRDTSSSHIARGSRSRPRARGAADRDDVATGRNIEMHHRLRGLELEDLVVVVAHRHVKQGRFHAPTIAARHLTPP